MSAFQLLLDHPLLNQDRRIPLVDPIRLQVLGRDRPRREHRMTARQNTGSHKRTRPDPCPTLDLNRLGNQVKRRRFVIVISRAEESPLRDADVAGDFDGCQV